MDEFKKDNDMETGYFPEGTEHSDVLKTMGNRDFVWDEAKNRHNLKIHHVDFETAMFVFNDEDRIEIYDESHSEDEDRWDVIGKATETGASEIESMKGVGPKLTLGKVKGLLFVVYTDKIILGREMIRLISARRASKFEELVYLNGGEGRRME